MIAGRSEWASRQLTRRRYVRFASGCEGFVAALEDVFIGKLVYYQEGGSEKHLRDIASILSQAEDDVDRLYIAEVAATLGLTEAWKLAANSADAAQNPPNSD